MENSANGVVTLRPQPEQTQAFTLEMAPAQSPESCFVCELHEEFFELLANADFRLKARLLLVSRYFEASERVALLESLGLCTDAAKRSTPRPALTPAEAERAGLLRNEEAEDMLTSIVPRCGENRPLILTASLLWMVTA